MWAVRNMQAVKLELLLLQVAPTALGPSRTNGDVLICLIVGRKLLYDL